MTTAPKVALSERLAKIDGLLRAYNEQDVDTILSYFTDDVMWESTGAPKLLTGKGEAGDMLRAQYVAFPDMHFPVEDWITMHSPDGKYIGASWRMVVTMTGEMDPPGFAPTGRTATVSGFCLYEFSGDLISHHKIVFDLMSFTQQLGIMPAEDSVAMKTMVGAQHLAGTVRTKLLHR